MFAVALLSAAVLAAPLPKDQPVVPLEKRLVGEWTLDWGGTEYVCQIGKDGSWTCCNESATWVGSWRNEGDRWFFEESRLDEQTGELGPCQEYVVEFEPNTLRGSRPGMTVQLKPRTTLQ
jgi:hypothetical protein